MFKDKSNERIVSAIMKLMKEEERGFLFCPVPKATGNHNTALVFIGNEDGTPIEEQVFATLMSLMDNIRRSVPEDDYKKWKKLYKRYLQYEMGLWNMGAVEIKL